MSNMISVNEDVPKHHYVSLKNTRNLGHNNFYRYILMFCKLTNLKVLFFNAESRNDLSLIAFPSSFWCSNPISTPHLPLFPTATAVCHSIYGMYVHIWRKEHMVLECGKRLIDHRTSQVV